MKRIPMLDLRLQYDYMKDSIDTAIHKCLDHQQWIFGPEIKELEDKVAEYLRVKHCIGVSSGTEALVLSLRSLAIALRGEEYFSSNDEIITTPFTFTATGDAIIRSGATPVFVDIDPRTYNIDVQKIREYLTSRKTSISKTVGMIPVHLYGQSCSMEEISKIAKEYNLFILEDVAQAFGCSWNGKKLGSLGAAGAFSFFPSKNLGGFGDGGMIATDDDKTMELVRMLLKHGGKNKYNVDHIGYNARLDTLHAAIILAKFRYIDEFNEKRKNIAEFYSEGLKNIDGIFLPNFYSNNHSVYNQYTVRVTENKRDELQKYLKENGISSMVYYPVPLHKMKVFAGRGKISGNLNEAEKASSEVLSLPVEPLFEKTIVEEVICKIKEFYR